MRIIMILAMTLLLSCQKKDDAQTTVLALKTTNQTIWIGNGLHCTYWYKFFLNDGRVIETLTKELKR